MLLGHAYTQKSDIHSLALVIWEIISAGKIVKFYSTSSGRDNSGTYPGAALFCTVLFWWLILLSIACTEKGNFVFFFFARLDQLCSMEVLAIIVVTCSVYYLRILPTNYFNRPNAQQQRGRRERPAQQRSQLRIRSVFGV